MLIEDELKRIYLNFKIKEIIPFLIKLTPKEKETARDVPLLNHLLNSCHGIYDQDLIHILYTAPYFSGSVFAKKYNETLCRVVYQCDSKANAEFLDVWLKLDLPFQLMHYLLLSAAIFSKDKTLSGKAFEAVFHRIVADDFDTSAFGIMIGEKVSFGLVPVKRPTDGLYNTININSGHNRTFEKLSISILSAIDQPVLILKTA